MLSKIRGQMGQGQSTYNYYAPLAAIFQDLERMKFAQDLRRQPADYTAYVNTRIDELSTEIFNRKRTAFQKAHIDLGRYMDMDHNANYYKARSGDVDRLTGVLADNNARVAQSLERDRDLSRRQFEINEWYNYNKLETLFFLQVFFMASLGMAIVIFLQKSAAITNALAALLTVLILVVVGGVGLYRYRYTKRTRDPRLWHRRYFEGAGPVKPVAKCDNNGNLDIDINKLIPKDVTQCADDAAGRFNKWQDSVEKEMLAYQTTGATPSRITGENTLLGSVCSNLQ
jgi:hypothetical protein